MLTKEEVLYQVKLLSSKGMLQKDELFTAYADGLGKVSEKSKAAKVLYYLGGGIVFLGIAILLGQKWAVLNAVTKIVSTLGVGVAAYYVALLFANDRRTESVRVAFFLISALVLPIGLYVTFDIAGYDTQSYGLQSLIFALLFLVYFLSQCVFKEPVLVFFSVIFATCFFHAFSYLLISDHPYLTGQHFFEYLFLATGISYLLLGNYFRQNAYKQLAWFFNVVGNVFFLGSALFLGGWKPNQNLIWELVFPVLIFAMLFTSIRIKSRSVLSFSTFFLMVYLVKITSEYFSDSLGWSLALVVSGLLVIASGYLFFALKRNI